LGVAGAEEFTVTASDQFIPGVCILAYHRFSSMVKIWALHALGYSPLNQIGILTEIVDGCIYRDHFNCWELQVQWFAGQK
jgi:hypothetical protein